MSARYGDAVRINGISEWLGQFSERTKRNHAERMLDHVLMGLDPFFRVHRQKIGPSRYIDGHP